MMNITSQIILEENLFMSFEIKDDKLWFELDEPDYKNLTISITFVDYEKKCTIKQDEYIEPLGVGSYIFVFNTQKKTSLSVIFKNNKLSFEELS